MRFYSSDQHFGHANIIKYCQRPFADLDDMHEQLVKRWNERVTDDDEVMILGDLVLGNWNASLPYLLKLKGRKILLPGNHDDPWPPRTRAEHWARRFESEAGIQVLPLHRVRNWPLAAGTEHMQRVDLAHFPYRDDHPDNDFRDTRHLEHWPSDDGRWLLHGHIHERWRIWPEARMLNVGVDVHDFAPISEAEVLRLINDARGQGTS